ncbi:hypothetical protein BS47DRAFT_1392426 [Hydnum rufescens UP504]|uniref:Gti1/Pac2 family-domain-containing protein n=1 Tax=Hydnum rufescens UP504 TaxID=1448309 RepID=A0A9P6AZA8_9AGAM|nr:hypothetical protein BS47DRAFT_1392426 [Hydnum rufescens UP504]
MLHVHPHAVQRPTHAHLHVRDTHDAHVLLEAVRLHKLQPVTRRLNEVERMSFIRSGSVFIWEESDDETGLRRWTDGLLWSASRMREPFLFYETRTLTPRYPPSNVPGLIKQTYSAMVTLPSANNSQPVVRKWHLTAYFEHGDLNSLLTIDRDPELCNIAVPPGVYRSGKSRQRRHSGENPGGLRWINVDGSGQVSDTGRPASSSPDASLPNSPSHSHSIRPAPNPDAYSPSPSRLPSPTQPKNMNNYLPYDYPPQPQLPPIAVGFATALAIITSQQPFIPTTGRTHHVWRLPQS